MKSNAYFRIVDEIDADAMDDTVTLPLPVLPHQAAIADDRESMPARQLSELIELAQSIDAKLDRLLKARTARKKAASKKTVSKKTASKKTAAKKSTSASRRKKSAAKSR